MEGCGGKDEQSNLFKGNNDTGTIIFLISLQSKPPVPLTKCLSAGPEITTPYLWSLIPRRKAERGL